MNNRRILIDLIDQMQDVSRKAADCIRAMEKHKSKKNQATKKTKKAPKSRKKTR